MQEILSRSQDAIRAKLRKEVGEIRYDLWLSHAVFRTVEDGVLEVGTPNIFYREWLKQHYAPSIAGAVKAVLGSTPRLCFAVDPELAKRFQEAQSAEEEGAEAPRPPLRTPEALAEAKRADLGLKPEFRLDNFVVGACNRLPFGAARSVCDEPGTLYNPLFIYGASGLGKTHLLQAVTREFIERRGAKGVVYLSCETFVNGFIESLKQRRLDRFRDRFRNLNLLVVDDVHILSRKNATQEEFLHTFNACFNHGRQIIMASDSHPNAIQTLRKELRGRFISGLMARLDPPSYMTRLAILREKARALPVAIPEDVLAFLAQHVRSNVRALEGALTNLVARASLLEETITLGEAAQALKMVEEDRERIITLGDVEDAIVTFFGISSAELHSKSRKRHVLVPRQICMHLARKLTSHSLKEIGQYFGKRDHVTVLYALRKVEEIASGDHDFERVIKDLEDRVKQPERWSEPS